MRDNLRCSQEIKEKFASSHRDSRKQKHMHVRFFTHFLALYSIYTQLYHHTGISTLNCRLTINILTLTLNNSAANIKYSEAAIKLIWK